MFMLGIGITWALVMIYKELASGVIIRASWDGSKK